MKSLDLFQENADHNDDDDYVQRIRGFGDNVLYKSTFYLRSFNGYFPGQPGWAGTRMPPFWILLKLKMKEVVVTSRAVRYAKLQSNRHHQHIKTRHFYRPDALPVAQPAASEH